MSDAGIHYDGMWKVGKRHGYGKVSHPVDGSRMSADLDSGLNLAALCSHCLPLSSHFLPAPGMRVNSGKGSHMVEAPL